jgi:hypothetical protein
MNKLKPQDYRRAVPGIARITLDERSPHRPSSNFVCSRRSRWRETAARARTKVAAGRSAIQGPASAFATAARISASVKGFCTTSTMIREISRARSRCSA